MTLDMLPVPYYQDELVRVCHADMADILPHLTDVPLYVGSPPYNLGTQPRNATLGRIRALAPGRR